MVTRTLAGGSLRRENPEIRAACVEVEVQGLSGGSDGDADDVLEVALLRLSGSATVSALGKSGALNGGLDVLRDGLAELGVGASECKRSVVALKVRVLDLLELKRALAGGGNGASSSQRDCEKGY